MSQSLQHGNSAHHNDPKKFNAPENFNLLKFEQIITFLTTEGWRIEDERPLQTGDPDAILDSMNFVITKVLRVVPDPDSEIASHKAQYSVGMAFRSRLSAVSRGLKQLGIADNFSLSDLIKVDTKYVRYILSRLIHFHEFVENFKKLCAPSLKNIKHFQSEERVLITTQENLKKRLTTKRAEQNREAEELKELLRQKEELLKEIAMQQAICDQTKTILQREQNDRDHVNNKIKDLTRREQELHKLIDEVSSKITRSPTRVKGEYEAKRMELAMNKKTLEELTQRMHGLERQVSVAIQHKVLAGERVADQTRLKNVHSECAVLEEKIQTSERTCKKLKHEETALTQLTDTLLRACTELQQDYQKIAEECHGEESKTKTLLNIEGLSLGEKESHLVSLKRNLTDAQKEKERLGLEIERRNADIRTLTEILNKANDSLNSIQVRYRTGLNQTIHG